MSDLHNDARSISRLLGDAFEQLSQLVQTEIRLARAELADKAMSAGIGVGLLFGGLLLIVPAACSFPDRACAVPRSARHVACWGAFALGIGRRGARRAC